MSTCETHTNKYFDIYLTIFFDWIQLKLEQKFDGLGNFQILKSLTDTAKGTTFVYVNSVF